MCLAYICSSAGCWVGAGLCQQSKVKSFANVKIKLLLLCEVIYKNVILQMNPGHARIAGCWF